MILDADACICRILGYSPQQLTGTRSLDLIHPDDHDNAIEAWMEMLTSPGIATRLRARHRHADGSWMWMELTNTNRLQHDETCVVCDMIDISEEMVAVEALRNANNSSPPSPTRCLRGFCTWHTTGPWSIATPDFTS